MNDLIRSLLAAALAAACAASLAACGRKTNPLPPDSPRPEAVQVVKAEARDNVAFLTWRIPGRNVEGRELPAGKVKAFYIERAEAARDTRRLRFRQIAVVELERPAPAVVSGGTVLWKDESLKRGQVYVYRVRAEGAEGAPGPASEEIRVAPLLTVASPQGVSASGGDGEVSVVWSVVSTKADGSLHEGFVGYNLYRGTAPGKRGEKPLNAEPLRTNAYRDRAVRNGEAYYYAVRAVDSPVPPWRESLDSDEVTATPRDLTPPARPAGITVVPGVGRAFLTWNESPEPDIAGYVVYRSEKSGSGYVRLMEKPLKRTTWSDENVLPGQAYYYAVAAVDAAGNESPLSKEQKAVPEAPR